MSSADDKARQRYQGAAGERYHQGKRSIPQPAVPWVARLRANKLAPFIQKTDIVFEYGVGWGWNLAALECARRIGFDVAEIVEPAVRELGIEFLTDAQRQADASVDVVICHHTLEHAWSPPEVLNHRARTS